MNKRPSMKKSFNLSSSIDPLNLSMTSNHSRIVGMVEVMFSLGSVKTVFSPSVVKVSSAHPFSFKSFTRAEPFSYTFFEGNFPGYLSQSHFHCWRG